MDLDADLWCDDEVIGKRCGNAEGQCGCNEK
jgi:hypothetical protein